MKILHVITQKPFATGSGVYLTGLIQGLAKLGHRQKLVAGFNMQEDSLASYQETLPEVELFALRYQDKELPFNVLGMSDVMPYPSTRYRDLDESMLQAFKAYTQQVLKEAVDERPDVILCEHLFLLTAFVRELFPDIPVYGICHETCLRQFQSLPGLQGFVRPRIGALQGAFALHQIQVENILKCYPELLGKIQVTGSGYDPTVFFPPPKARRRLDLTGSGGVIEVVYTGKLALAKGVLSLLRALMRFQQTHRLPVRLRVIGAGSDPQDLKKIHDLAARMPYPVEFLGRLKEHQEVAEIYRASDLFVLPSFFEGLPLVLIEACACAVPAVCTDIPGVKQWIEHHAKTNGAIRFVKRPPMQNLDTPHPEGLEAFEERLSEAMYASLQACSQGQPPADVRSLTWDGLAKRIDACLQKALGT